MGGYLPVYSFKCFVLTYPCTHSSRISSIKTIKKCPLYRGCSWAIYSEPLYKEHTGTLEVVLYIEVVLGQYIVSLSIKNTLEPWKLSFI